MADSAEHPILRPAQAGYLDALLPPRDALQREMEELARRRDIPICQPQTGRLLEVLARASRGRRLLEVGTAIGYGTLCLARGAPEATVLSIDRDPEMVHLARGFLERAGVAERVLLVTGDAAEKLPELEPPLDLVWIDADKSSYRRYLDLVLPKVAVGGLVVADNLLWGGRVAEPPAGGDREGEALAAFNGYLMMHPQLRSVVLPHGDGIGLAVKTRPLVTELGGPF